MPSLLVGRLLAGCAIALAVPGVAAAQFSLASAASDGTPGNGPSGPGVAISADGRYVVFSSLASNLVAGDTNGSADVFVKDRQTAAIARVSVASDGTERIGDSGLEGVAISADGRIVAFSSRAALVADDTNTCARPAEAGTGPSCTDVYVHDRTTGQTTRVSVAGTSMQADNASGQPVLSADGRLIAFASVATNLVAGDTNGVSDVFLRDRVTQATTRLSVSTAGVQGDLASDRPAMSDDGNIVAFVSASTTLTTVPQPTACPANATACFDGWMRDRAAGTTTRLSTAGEGFFLGAGLTRAVGVIAVDVSADGRTLVSSIHQYPSDRAKGSSIVLHDLAEPSSYKIAAKSGGFVTATASGDGRWVVTADRGPLHGFHIVDRRTRATLDMVSFTATVDAVLMEAGQFDVSADGRFIAFAGAGNKKGEPAIEGIVVFDQDTDGDDMIGTWEESVGLNPTDASDAALDPDGDGSTSLQEYVAGTHPTGTTVRYFAEGAHNDFFRTAFGLFNVGASDAHILLRYVGTEGQQRGQVLTIQPLQPGNVSGFSSPPYIQLNNFSTVIESDQPIVADRVMGWGDGPTMGSHGETAIEAPSKTWYLAEGATHGGFDLFYLLQNPTDTRALVSVEYQRPAPAPPIVRNYAVGAHSRRTIWVDAEGPELDATDVSAAIVSDQPIIVERAMYLSRPGLPFLAGHDGAGVTAPSINWFLAEGATGQFFDMYVLIANPGDVGASLSVSYLRPSGPPIVKTYIVAAHSRRTISVADEDPALADTAVSVTVTSTNAQPVIVERSMWWPHPTWYEGHLSVGSTATATTWAFAEVASGIFSFPQTFVLIANTANVAGSASIRLYFNNGKVYEHVEALPPNSRTNVQLSQVFLELGQSTNYGIIVESNGVPIVVERATYEFARASELTFWSAGYAALATRLP